MFLDQAHIFVLCLWDNTSYSVFPSIFCYFVNTFPCLDVSLIILHYLVMFWSSWAIISTTFSQMFDFWVIFVRFAFLIQERLLASVWGLPEGSKQMKYLFSSHLGEFFSWVGLAALEECEFDFVLACTAGTCLVAQGTEELISLLGESEWIGLAFVPSYSQSLTDSIRWRVIVWNVWELLENPLIQPDEWAVWNMTLGDLF